MMVVAKIILCITGHGANVAHELNHLDILYFTAESTWQRNKWRGHKHGCLLQQFQVIATIGINMLMKAPVKLGVRVINEFESVSTLSRFAIFSFLLLRV